ncbi:HAD family hydrolase [Mycoplasmopsis felis]|uniref:HAD family hydrolase n=1 Tax=Mycoplasmopsis felis TaxID=33923 RepID=UPI002AF6B41F|nr:HAD family hydrolase [Mycoplasmopsis felis]WQQ01427.1 HAD family hydrolase [Mycoplasmopsis felis]WQQ08617.1 HAD family hydrolase [Mycoplasmopsis felis]WQQ09080.1 HAD family hydrolase [Mycoplasmopsis felis]
MKKEEIKEIKKPKIIFIDLDGTTLDGPGEKFWQKEATEYTKNVINKLQKSIPVIVSTGRGVNPKTQAIVNSFGSSTYIAWNGAKTVINGEVAHSNSIPKEIANELFEEIKKHKCFVVYDSNPRDNAYTKNKIYKLFMSFGKKTAKNYSEYNKNFEPLKALVWCLSKNKIMKLYHEWSKKFEGKLNVSLSGSNNILEITNLGVSKGDEEVRLCKLWGIDPMEAMHIGDSNNDASTKGKIGTLVAMANSHQDLKDIADDFTEFTCDESGLARYLEQFLD